MAKRTLHPKMVERAQAVKTSHAHLSKTIPGFKELHPHERTRMTQFHASGQLAKKKGGC